MSIRAASILPLDEICISILLSHVYRDIGTLQFDYENCLLFFKTSLALYTTVNSVFQVVFSSIGQRFVRRARLPSNVLNLLATVFTSLVVGNLHQVFINLCNFSFKRYSRLMPTEKQRCFCSSFYSPDNSPVSTTSNLTKQRVDSVETFTQ